METQTGCCRLNFYSLRICDAIFRTTGKHTTSHNPRLIVNFMKKLFLSGAKYNSNSGGFVLATPYADVSVGGAPPARLDYLAIGCLLVKGTNAY